MFWRKVRQEPQEPKTQWGALRIRRCWDGTYHIEQYCYDQMASLALRRTMMTWDDLAGGLLTQEDAAERIRFMGKEQLLINDSKVE